ncbi:hypothetical protein [Stenotrophomonas sp.]|uniref:hypothetical protein n=1 Tax=Stenotrophomonas sp. TaxID=69392 RepID=UPI00289D3063|nr:hypothetical protein [Stenotrophomonas sp.]
MTDMNKYDAIKHTSALALCLGLAVACARSPGQAANSEGDSNSAESSTSTASKAAPTDHAGSQQAETSSPPSGMNVERYLCGQTDQTCRRSRDPLAARSKSEAAWMVAHGYPDKQHKQSLDAMTLDQLQVLASSGDRSASVIYAQKTALFPQGFYDGVGMLRDEALSGNLYAYYGLSEVYRGSNQHKNLVDSAAYLRLAYLLGDWRATYAIGTLGLSPIELAAADERAASLLQTFAEGSAPSPRPLE